MDKIISMIGMATKAGRTASGEFMTERAVKKGDAFLVIVAEDASENTKKMFENMCTFYQIPFYIYGTKETLGHRMGKAIRASLAILDQGFGDAVKKRLDESGNCSAKSSEEMR